MTIRQLVEGIDLYKQTGYEADLNKIAEEFDINYYFNDRTDRLKYYYTKAWLCTDTWVGERSYFLDGEFVMYSCQSARKAGEYFTFVSVETRAMVKEYIMSLIAVEEEAVDTTTYLNLDEEIPNRFQVGYNSQILNKVGWYKDKLVKIGNTRFPYKQGESDDYFYSVVIDLDGNLIKVHVKELWFDYNTI